MNYNRKMQLFVLSAAFIIFIVLLTGCTKVKGISSSDSLIESIGENRTADINSGISDNAISDSAAVKQDDPNLKLLNGKKVTDLSVPNNKDASNTRVSAELGAKSGKKVDPGLFGVNMLFFTEKDKIRSDAAYQTSVKYLNPSIMRYPGGTAGDNYLWKKNDIYTTDWYPNKSMPDNMDTDEFLEFSAKYGSERMMVINYRSYIKMNDRDAFLKDAEDWVKYVNIDKKAGVKYWELGNELFFKENSEIRTQFTPEQLGADYLELRKRLKAIDPSIQLGLTLYKEWDTTLRKNVVPNWNERLMKAVKCDVDFIIVHIYSTPSEISFETKGAEIKDKIDELRKGIAGLGGRPDIPVLMTEWNYGADSTVIEGQKLGHLVGLAQGFLELIDSNIERATIWPMMNSDTRLILQNEYELAPAGEMFYWLNKELAGCEIVDVKTEKKALNVEIKAFLSPDGKQLRIVAVNRSQTKEEQAEISLKGYPVKDRGTLSTLMSSNTISGKKVSLSDKTIVLNEQQLNTSNTAVFKLPPLSVSILEIPVSK